MRPTHLMKELNDAALALVKELWKAPDPIRLLSVTAIYLTEDVQTYQQLDLLGTSSETQEKQEKVESAMDALRQKYGANVIAYGTAEKDLGNVRERD